MFSDITSLIFDKYIITRLASFVLEILNLKCQIKFIFSWVILG